MMRPSRTSSTAPLTSPSAGGGGGWLDHLTFGEFVEALARSPAKVAGLPQVVGDKAAAPPVAADGAAVPLLVAVRAAAHNGMPRPVAPGVSPLLPSFVSLYSSPCVCSPVLIRCLSFVVCYRWVLCLTVLQSSACLLVFPLRGGFCSSLFYIIIKRTIPLHLSPRPHLFRDSLCSELFCEFVL